MSGVPVDAFTISSNNYLGMARVFADSYLEHHPGARVYVCLVDLRDSRVAYDELPLEIVLAEELGIPRFDHFAFKYDILELNTAVKPFMFRYLRDKIGLDRAFYFDPDILIHDRLRALEESLASHQAVLTPHLTEPLDNRYRPPERFIGTCGVYNLGFLGLKLDTSTSGFLDWWCDRLHRFCVVDLANGMFVDQSWMDFAPSYLDSVAIVRDPIFNVAYWNLPHREPRPVGDRWEIGERRVGFFHFSGVDLTNLAVISRHQDRIDLWQRPELRPLFEHYRDLVESSGQSSFSTCNYHFGRFEGGGTSIPPSARNTLHDVDPSAVRWPNPFLTGDDDSFLAWLSEPVLLAGKVVNRVALGLWRDRADIREEFPKLEQGDLGRYIDWYLHGGAKAAGLGDIFIEPLRAALVAASFEGRDGELERAAAIDLANPGDDTDWLNQPVADGPGPVVTRLALLIHRTRLDLKVRFPDPLGQHRLHFAYWMVSDGFREYRLHSSLVSSTRRSLPLRSRVSLPLRMFAARMRNGRMDADPGRLPSPDLPSPVSGIPLTRQVPEIARPQRFRGVNLVGYFEGSKGAGCFAPWIEAELQAGGLPYVRVPLDHWLVEDSSLDRFRHDSGFPYQLTVLAVEPSLWNAVVRQIPYEVRAGGRVVGYCHDPAELHQVRSSAAVDAIWVPTADFERCVSEVTSIPVRRVVVTMPSCCERASTRHLSTNAEIHWLVAVDQGGGEENARATSATIECVRRLSREQVSGWRLSLIVGKDRFDLAGQVAHLPISFEVILEAGDEIDGLLARCSGFVDLRSSPHLNPLMVRAAARGVPIISAWNEFECRSRGSSVEHDRSSDHAGAAGGAIEAIVEAMRSVLGGRGSPLDRSVDLGSAISDAFRAPGHEHSLRHVIGLVSKGADELLSEANSCDDSILNGVRPETSHELESLES